MDKIKMGLSDIGIKEAYRNGYRVIDGNLFNPKGKQLKVRLSKDGYYRFNKKIGNNKTANIKLHRLVAFQKYGDKVFNKKVCVRHLDGNSKNNMESNIAIGTFSENSQDIPKEKRVKHATHAASFLIKYDWDKIRNDRKLGMSYSQLMNKHGVKSKACLSYQFNKGGMV